MTVDAPPPPPVSRAKCLCCASLGQLPGELELGTFGQVVGRKVAGDVLEQMCDECVAGKFSPGPQLCPHPMLDGRP